MLRQTFNFYTTFAHFGLQGKVKIGFGQIPWIMQKLRIFIYFSLKKKRLLLNEMAW